VADQQLFDERAKACIDSAVEIDYYRHGGVLQLVLAPGDERRGRQLKPRNQSVIVGVRAYPKPDNRVAIAHPKCAVGGRDSH